MKTIPYKIFNFFLLLCLVSCVREYYNCTTGLKNDITNAILNAEDAVRPPHVVADLEQLAFKIRVKLDQQVNIGWVVVVYNQTVNRLNSSGYGRRYYHKAMWVNEGFYNYSYVLWKDTDCHFGNYGHNVQLEGRYFGNGVDKSIQNRIVATVQEASAKKGNDMYQNAQYMNDLLKWDTIITDKASQFGYAICAYSSRSPEYWGILMNQTPYGWTYFTFIRHFSQ